MSYEDVTIELPLELKSEILLEHTSYWHVCAIGPPAYGQFVPVKMSMDLIYRETQEEAIETARENIADNCRVWGREYEEEQWSILHAVLMNGN